MQEPYRRLAVRRRPSSAVLLVILWLIALPSAATTILVTGTGDSVTTDGVCTLREAILSAEGTPANADCVAGSGANDIIHFNIAGAGLPKVIFITSPLPVLTVPMTIDAVTQPGASANTNAAGDNAVLGVELDGTGAGSADGLVINGPEPPASTTSVNIFNLGFRNFGGAAIRALSGGNSIGGCFIGVDGGNGSVTGDAAIVIRANAGVHQQPTVIGNGVSLRDVISGNPHGGISITADPAGSVAGFGIFDNYIGTNAAGTAVLANGGPGILISGVNGNIGTGSLPGGVCTQGCNLISGNEIGVKAVGVSVNFTGASLAGNLIGTDLTGTVALGNGAGSNVFADGTVGSGQLILGSTNSPNVISGAAAWGVEIVNPSSGHIGAAIFTDVIGTDITGNAAVPNALGGIRVLNGNVSTVLLGTPALNLISGNGGPGIRAEGTSFLSVAGVFVGTKTDGVTALGNNGNGIELIAAGANVPSGGTIGDPAHPNLKNIIAFNSGAGIAVTAGRHLTINGSNSIFGNTGLGIDLGPAGATPNDPCDADTGANDLQNFPVLTSASTDGASSTTIAGTLNSVASQTFRIEFFANPAAPAQAKTFLGFTTVTTDGACNASFTATLPVGVTPGSLITATATATDPSLLNTSEISGPVSAQGPLAVTKSFAAPSFPRNGTTLLTITLTNQSSAGGATSVAFTDNYPAGLVNATPLSTTNSCGGTLTVAAGGNSIALTGASLAASSSCTVTVQITSATPGVYTNTIAAGGATSSLGPNPTPASASVTVTGDPSPAKSFSPSTIATGSNTTLTITLSNTAATATTGVAFTDTYPTGVKNVAVPAPSTTCGGTLTAAAGTGSVQLTGGTIPAAGTCTVTVTLNASSAGVLVNTIAAGAVTSSNAGANVAPATATLTVLDPIGAAKSFTPPSINVGGTSQITITLTNPNASALNNLGFTDTYPTGLLNTATPAPTTTCGGTVTATGGTNQVSLSGGTLQPSGTCTVKVFVSSASSGSYTNLIPAGAVTAPPVASGADASATLTVVTTPITVGKQFVPATVTTGSNTQMTITLTNGDVIPMTGVAFTDSYPAGLVNAATPAASTSCGGTLTANAGAGSLSLTGGTIPASGSCTVTVTLTANTAGSLTNTIGIGAVTTNEGSSNTTAGSATLTVNDPPGVTKSFSPNPIAPGGTSTLTVTLTNPNGVNMTGVAFTDTYPGTLVNALSPSASSSCAGGTVSASSGGNTLSLSNATILANSSCSVTVIVTSGTPGTFTNTIAAGTVTTTNSGSSTVTASDTLSVLNPPSASKAFAPTTIAPGGTSTLTVTLTNSNPVPLTGVAFTDTFPSGLVIAATPNVVNGCGGTPNATAGSGSLSLTGGAIAASSPCSISVDVTSPTAHVYLNSIAAGAVTSSGGSSTSAASATLNVLAAPSVGKSFAPTTIAPNGTSTLSVTLVNPNNAALTAVAFTDNYPAGLVNAATPGGASSCGGTVTANGGGGSLSLTGATIPASSICTVSVSVTSAAGGSYTNTIPAGAVTSSSPDTSASASATLGVLTIVVGKSFSPAAILPSGTSQLQINLSNPTNTPITGVAFTDTYPAGMVNAPATNGVSLCGGTVTANAGAGTLSLTGASIPANGNCTVSANVTTSASGSFTNTIAAGDVTGSGTSNTSPASATLNVQPGLSISKSFAQNPIPTGGTSTLTITLANSSATAGTGVGFTDSYPTNLVNAPTPNASSTCGGTLTASAGAGSLSLSGAGVPAGGNCTVSVDLTSNTAGNYNNTIPIGAISSNLGSNSAAASANLGVIDNGIGVAKAYNPAAIQVGQNTTLTITLTNLGASPINGIAFFDPLPGNVPVAAVPNIVNTCGGTVTAAPNGASVSLSGGSLAGSSSCTVSVDMTANTTGAFVNTIGAGSVTGNGGFARNGADATATVLVGNGLSASKSFTPSVINAGGTSQLTVTLASTAGFPIHNVAFNDVYPPGVVNAPVPNVTNTCGGTVTATAGGNSLAVSGATAPASFNTCTITVMVTSNVLGSHINTIPAGGLTSSDGGSNSDAATGSLFVQAGPFLNVTKTFTPASIPAGGVSHLTVTFDNPNPGAFASLQFNDVFPSGLLVAAVPNASTTCGGTITPAPGGTSFSFSGGAVGGNSTCVAGIDVTSAAAGSYTNTIDSVTATAGGSPFQVNSAPVSATLDVVSGLGITKSFSAASIPINGTATLTISLFNSGPSPSNGLAFTDTYPSGLVNALVPNASTTCGGTLTASSGGGSVSLTGGSIAAGGSCTVRVDLTSAAAGTYTNSIAAGAVTAGAQSNTFGAAATLSVLGPPAVAKAYSPSSIGSGGVSRFAVTITNPNTAAIHGIAFTDLYPAGVVNSATPNAVTTCGGTVSATAGGSSLALSGGSLPAGAGCTVSIDVTSSTVGGHTNTLGAGAVTTSEAGASTATASGTLTVLAGINAVKSFSPGIIAAGATSQLTITLTNTNAVPAGSVAFTDNYPPSRLTNAAVPNATTSCGGTVSAPAGTQSLSFSGGTIPANGSCTVSVMVTSSIGSPDPIVNDMAAGDVTSSAGPSVAPTSATLIVLQPPDLIKQFAPSQITPGGISRMTVTIINFNLIFGGNFTVQPFTGVALTDNYPPGIINAPVPNATSTCGGTVAAAPGGSSLTLSGATAGTIQCNVSVDVTSTALGTYTNTLVPGSVTTTNANANTSTVSGTLFVVQPVNVTKSFNPPAVPVGTNSTLTVSVANPNATDVTKLFFLDDYPLPVTNAPAPPPPNVCGGVVFSFSDPSASGLLLDGATIPAGQTCAVSVPVTSAVTGVFNNTITTDLVSAENAAAPADASAQVQFFVRPSITKAFASHQILLGQTTTMTVTLTNLDTSPIPAVAFTDSYPAGLQNAAAPNASSTCGGTVTATPGGSSLSLAGAAILGSSSCTVTVTLAGVAGGVFTNTIPIDGLTVYGAGVNTAAASDTITVVAPPGVAKSFTPSSILPGGTSTLTVTLTNTNGQPITGVAFTDTYPAGLTNATPSQVTSTCGGTATAAAGGGSLALTGGLIPTAGQCTVSVVVTATGVANYANTIPAGGVSSANAGSNIGGAAGATLAVTLLSAPSVTKSFFPANVVPLAPSTLTITFTNPNAIAVDNVSFVDTYPAGVTNALTAVPASTCGGTVTAAANGTTLTLLGGTIPPNGSCTVTTLVVAGAPGSYTNVLPAGSISSNNAGANGGPVSGTLLVGNPADIPTLPPLGLLALAALLALASLLVLRGRG